MKLGELIRAAMLAAFKKAAVIKLKRVRRPKKRLQYPRASDKQTIAHYDASVRAWLANGREGPRPIRRVAPKAVRA